MTTTSVSQIARTALLNMARDGISPTPEAYKKYYNNVTGTIEKEPENDTLHAIKLKISEYTTPDLAEWKAAIDVALLQRDWKLLEKLMLESIIKSAPVNNICDRSTCIESKTLHNIVYVMESFASNLENLFPDNISIKSQVEIIKDILADPTNHEKLYSAKRALSRLSTPGVIQSQLIEARQFAKTLAIEFLKHMESTGDVTEDMLANLTSCKDKIEKAVTQDELLHASKGLVSVISDAQNDILIKQDAIAKTIHQSNMMENRVKELETQLQIAGEQTKQDYLTGLLNRRGMDQELNKIFKDDWKSVVVALLDIDNFKKINDSLGHAIGDLALKHLADAITLAVKDKGIAARLGGEEFVIIYPGATTEYVKKEMQLLQRYLTKEIFMANNEQRLVTFSAGVAAKRDTDTPDQVLTRADEAMYQAKQEGKNRVVVA